MCAMDSVQDHAENEDKHLISHVAGISNYADTVSVSSDKGLSLDGERGRQLASVVVNNANYNLLLRSSFVHFKFPFSTFHIYNFYCLFCKICNICSSECKSNPCEDEKCDCKCSCTCKCEHSCKSKTICVCICNEAKPQETQCCICICKKENSKCVCICICKNGQNCCCGSTTSHECKVSLKIEVGSLKDQSYKIIQYLYRIRSCISRIENKCCVCSCCKIVTCHKSCCTECELAIKCYKSIVLKLRDVVLLFKDLGSKIPQLQTLKNLLSSYNKSSTTCPKCPDGCCKDKIKDLIKNIERALHYFYLFGSRINEIGPFVEYRLNYNKSKQILGSIQSSMGGLSKQLLQINNYILEQVNYNISLRKLSIIVYSYYFICQCFLKIYMFLQYLSKVYPLLEIIKIVECCRCVCNFKPKNNNGFDLSDFDKYVTECCDKKTEELKKLDLKNDGNHFCMCIVIKYVLYPSLIKSLYFLRYLYLETSSKQTKEFIKNKYSRMNTKDTKKLIHLIIIILDKIGLWMKYNYLCTCPPDCPCLKNCSQQCTSDCRVCHLPKVKCCECPKEHSNCVNGRNCCCCCKCAKTPDPGCRCCSEGCSEGQCCRCCCNCFCKSHNDSYYPYLVSIILYLSSLIQNIWAIDNQAIVKAIQSLSNLYSELKIYDFSSIDIRPVSCSKVCGLITNKQCQKEGEKKCCCWCVTIVNVLVACVSLCLQCKICKAICTKTNGICDKIKTFCEVKECTCKCPQGSSGCCLLKLALCSQLPNNEELQKSLKDCCEKCGEEPCCKKISGMLKSRGDLLLIGCNCEAEGDGDQVKGKCVLFNNLWGGRSAAVVIICKCEKGKCCCLKDVMEKIQDPLKKLCEQCICDELKEKLKQFCTDSGCCGAGCPCSELKKEIEKICGKNSQCLCQEIKKLKDLCAKPDCQCKKEGCCRCVCCKLAIAGVRILVRACRQNFLEPYKRITLDLISSSINKIEIRRKILDSINSGREKQVFLVKNNYSTHFNTYTDHKNIANSFPSLTLGYAYDTVYEHQITVNGGYAGINGIRKADPNDRNRRIKIRNKL